MKMVGKKLAVSYIFAAPLYKCDDGGGCAAEIGRGASALHYDGAHLRLALYADNQK